MRVRLILIAALFVVCQSTYVLGQPTRRGEKENAKAKAVDTNKKIDEFFRPLNPRKRSAPTPDGPVCPTQSCRGIMVERLSSSLKNNGRRYLKCPTCGAFQWKGQIAWCDSKGNWSGHEPFDRGYDYGSEWSRETVAYDNPYECHLYREAMEAQEKKDQKETEGASEQ